VTGIVVLDKPLGLSSNTALQRVRHLFQAAKAGHTGSLDPLATGVLPICLGEATKLSGYLLDADKRYRVRAAVGTCTNTADAEGEVTKTSDASQLTRAALVALFAQFTGDIRQRPPMYSALKRDGQPLYKLAREGIEVEREARPVTVYDIQLLDFGPGSFTLDVRCGKGTYIRSLVEDLAAAAGQCAHVAELRRTAAGPFLEDRMLTLETLETLAGEGLEALDARLIPLLDGLPGMARVPVDEAAARRLAQGQSVCPAGLSGSGRVAVTGPFGQLLGIAEIGPGATLVPKRWLA
jgi:tRNA pseudouridine55 synthase